MNIQRVVWIVYGVCLNTEGRAGHNVQAVRGHEPKQKKEVVSLRN